MIRPKMVLVLRCVVTLDIRHVLKPTCSSWALLIRIVYFLNKTHLESYRTLKKPKMQSV